MELLEEGGAVEIAGDALGGGLKTKRKISNESVNLKHKDFRSYLKIGGFGVECLGMRGGRGGGGAESGRRRKMSFDN